MWARIMGAALVACVLVAGGASARDVALVIGNSAYADENELGSPGRDTQAVAERLTGLGFEVEVATNLDRAEFYRTLQAFSRTAAGAETALIYYAGHGMEIGETNFLIPVDAVLDAASDAEFEGVPLARARGALSGATRLQVLIVDACRDNRFRLANANGQVAMGGQARGLRPPSARPGEVIVFSTKGGAIARDGGDVGLSPFAQAFTETLDAAPALDVRVLFTSLGPRVAELAGERQEPEAVFGASMSVRAVTLSTGGATRNTPAVTTPADPAPNRPASGVDPSPPILDENGEPYLLGAELTATTPAGTAFRDVIAAGQVGPEMVILPEGSFTMGSPTSEANRHRAEGPQRRVDIAYRFAVSATEITFRDWEACVRGGGCRANPAPDPEGWGRGERPVINVSWSDAQDFVGWLSEATGATYRLLSEAEWEYAARAQTDAVYHPPYGWGDAAPTCDRRAASGANFRDCTGEQTHPVGRFAANAFGLYDMHGNVWEWTADCMAPSYADAPSDGSAWPGLASEVCEQRVLRGGGWYNLAGNIRSAMRGAAEPDERTNGYGVRVARMLPR